ncbi:MAG: hypothetical protein KC613_00130 [Myxococcales bacterium]|nr:hypothetical protein [Myxococcales bacterium]
MTSLALGALLGAGCGSEPEVRQGPEPIDQFYCGMTQGDGVDLRRVTERAMPSIWRVLEDNTQRRCWNEALVVAGNVGGPEAYVRLVGFIEARAASFALSEDMVYLQTAFVALAQVAVGQRTDRSSAQAVDFLVESSDPTTWEKRAIDWELDAVMKRELIRVLTSAAVRAMAAVDDPKVHERVNLLAVEAADSNAYRFKYRDTDPAPDIAGQLINLHVLPPGRVAYAMLDSLARSRGESDQLKVDAQEAIKSALDADKSIDEARRRGAKTDAEAADRKAREARAKADSAEVRRVELGALAKDVEALRRKALDAYQKEQAWLAARRGEQAWLKAIADANALADVRLNGLHGQLRSLKDLLDDSTSKQAIQAVEEVIFPEGPLPVIDSDFPEQVKFVLAACKALETRFAADLKRLKLVSHVQVTREAHEALDKALRSGIGGQGFEEVLRARARLQISLRVLVAKIIAEYPGYTKGDRETRDIILEPILNQNEQVTGFMSRRVQVRDVDPESGQELDPLEEGGAIDKSKTPGIGDPELLRRKIRQHMRDEADDK